MTAVLRPTAAELHPSARLAASQRKIRAPFTLDPTMCFYSPQTNVDALSHPRVVQWLQHIRHEWVPTPVPGERARWGLLLPCTKMKPYVTSREHLGINQALLTAGWTPVGAGTTPAELFSVLADDQDAALLHTGPLLRDGVVLDRFVMSEPLALVPYEQIMYFGPGQSPATSYDDSGLFEARGSAVSPERADCTATQRSDGSWSWGPAERAAYVHVHNEMAAGIAAALTRLASHYAGFVAWTSPGLTHRSFLADNAFRRRDGLLLSRDGGSGPLPLVGALDLAPEAVTILPSRSQLETAKQQLTERLASEGRATTASSVAAVFARGDGHDTPLGLPELTAQLVAALDELMGA